MNRLASLTLAAAMTCGAAQAQTPALQASPPVEVLRAGDAGLSCDALRSESNSLGAQLIVMRQQAQQHDARVGAGKSVAAGTTAASIRAVGRFGIGRLAGHLGPMGSMVALAASKAAADHTGAAMAQVTPTVTLEEILAQQRMARVQDLYRAGSCDAPAATATPIASNSYR